MRARLVVRALVAELYGGVPAATPDFSGLWRPDPAASTREKVLKDQVDPRFGPAPPPPPPGLAIHPVEGIDHEGSALTIASVDANGRDVSALALTIDRSEVSNAIAGGLLTHKSRSWWDGGELHVEWTTEREGVTIMRGTDVRTLLDPTRMRLVRDLEDGKSRTHAVIVLLKASPAPAGAGFATVSRPWAAELWAARALTDVPREPRFRSSMKQRPRSRRERRTYFR